MMRVCSKNYLRQDVIEKENGGIVSEAQQSSDCQSKPRNKIPAPYVYTQI